jgi:metal-responsive CopG/Arc/MetJ family transcriptional regulator
MALKKYAVVLNMEVLKELDQVAKLKERSRSFMLRKAIEELLQEEKKK